MKTKSTHTCRINKIQKRYPGSRRQRNFHGAGSYSVDFFSRATGELIASHNL